MAQKITTAKRLIWGPRIAQGALVVLTITSSRIVRMSILILAAALVAYLVYTNVSLPLQQSVELPAGVLDRNPGINTELIEQVNARQIERTQARPRSFTAYNRFFAPLPPPSPAP